MDNRNIIEIIRDIVNEEIDLKLEEIKQKGHTVTVNINMNKDEDIKSVVDIVMEQLRREIRMT